MKKLSFGLLVFFTISAFCHATSSDIGRSEPKYIPDGSGIGLTYNVFSYGKIIIKKFGASYYRLNDPSGDWSDRKCYDFTFSPDGKKIAYIIEEYDFDKDTKYKYYLKVQDLKGNEIESRELDNIKYSSPIFSPDSASIAFITENRKGGVYLWIMDTDGSGIKRLADSARVNPVFTTDGKNIIFATYNGGNYCVSLINADGLELTLIADFHAPIEKLALSPDGEKLLIVAREFDKSYILNKYNIYIIGTDGAGLTKLTGDDTHDYNPVFFPDGESIAYVSLRDGISDASYETPRYEKSKIYLMDVDGTNKRRLTGSNLGEINPNISPDGKKVIFTECEYFDQHPCYHSIIQIDRDGTGRSESFEAGFDDI